MNRQPDRDPALWLRCLDDVRTPIVGAPFERACDGAKDFDSIFRFLTGRGFVYEGSPGSLTSRGAVPVGR